MPLEQAEIPLQRTNDGEKLPDPTHNQSSANSSFDICVPTGLIFGPFLTFWFPKMLQAYLASSLPLPESAMSPRSPNSSYWRPRSQIALRVLNFGTLPPEHTSLGYIVDFCLVLDF